MLLLPGVDNFRDLGGHRTGDGRTVRYGVVYRSGHLGGLTEAGCKTLRSLGLRLVCDLRLEVEKAIAPTRWRGAAPEFLESAFGYAPEFAAALKNGGDAARLSSLMAALYKRLPLEGAPHYRAIFERILAGDTPLLVHCTGGKDRTGVFSALLLSALGVRWNWVLEDYLLSNKCLLNGASKLDALRAMLGPGVKEDAVFAVTEVRAEWLDLAFASIRAAYGSLDGYFFDALGLGPERLAGLRALLLT